MSSDGQETLVEVQSFEPYLVLLDIMMPGTDGVFTQLREIKPRRKVIMITAVDDEDIAREAMERGAGDYVTKLPDLICLDSQMSFQLLS